MLVAATGHSSGSGRGGWKSVERKRERKEKIERSKKRREEEVKEKSEGK